MFGYAAAWIALVGCLLGQCLAVPHAHDVQPAEHAAVPHVHLTTAHGHRHGLDGHQHEADGHGPAEQAESPAETVDPPHDSDCLFPADADVASRASDAKSIVAAEMPAAPLAATSPDIASVAVVAPPCDTFPPPCPRFLRMRNLRL